MRSTSLQQWAIAGFVLAAVTIFGLAGMSWNYAQQTLKASNFVSHTHEVIGAIKNAESNLYRAEAAQRGYLGWRGPAFVVERDAALAQLDLGLSDLARLTRDNADQQTRLAELRREIETRIAIYRRNEAAITNGDVSAVGARLADGVRALAHIGPRVQAPLAEEQRLLAEREDAERERSQAAGLVFSVLIAGLLVLLPIIFWRVRRELRARWHAEQQIAEERRYDAVHARALTLYNAEGTRSGVVEGTLSLLAENPLFAVAVFYAHEELGGVLRLESAHSAPADVAGTLRLQDGAIGTAARTHRPVYLEEFSAAEGLRIQTGLATLQPAALLMCPAVYQGRLLGVLALACAAPLGERDRSFVERLCAQLGVALHNLGQLQELGLLADQLRLRGHDVQQKNAELEKASRMKSEFLANMSHELRTPLNAVIGFSELMKDGLAGPLTAEQADYIGDIHSSGSHLLALINDILDLSKVESGHMELELEPLQPQQLVDSAVSVMRERASRGRISLTTTCDEPQARLLVDLRKTRQIVYNLLSNALKFTPEGGTVSLELQRVSRAEMQGQANARDSRVFAPTDRVEAAFLQIRVSDSGIGIAAKDLEQLFQPFVQIESTLSRRFEGTGLGLSLLRRLAELHGGGLMVRSTPGQGSVFTVWLPWRSTVPAPAVATPAALPGAVMAGAEPTGGAATAPLVLVVEDDNVAAKALRLQLQSQGYRVEIAHSAEEGLAQARLLKPAVLVLDIILPGMDGWDMLAELKHSDDTRQIPVVVVSVTDEARRGFTLGAAQVLCKPVTQDALLRAVAAAGLQTLAGEVRVMVVDDDPKAVTLVSKHLTAGGFTPLPAYSGQEAVDLAHSHRPDLIILDLMMPEVTGFDVLRLLREQPATEHVPVIVLTAQILNPQERQRLRGEVLQVIEKSAFEPAALLAEIKRVLAHDRAWSQRH